MEDMEMMLGAGGSGKENLAREATALDDGGVKPPPLAEGMLASGDLAGTSPPGEIGDAGQRSSLRKGLASLEEAGKEVQVVETEEEAEFVFEDDEEAVKVSSKWLAVGRFYSGRDYKARVIFSELSNAWGEVHTRGLGDHKYLIEFPSESALNFVLRGGPWKFKGDAMIVVPYDGFTRLSEVVIETIPLWIRIYDIPVGMMITSFVSALAAKVGKVLEIGEAAFDFRRVRVEFALANPLMDNVQIRVHDLYEEGVRFGTDLRTSPFKREIGRQMAFIAAAPAAKRGLNFSGAQREKVASFSASSTPSRTGSARMGVAAAGGGSGGRTLENQMANALAKGVQKLEMKDQVRGKEMDTGLEGIDEVGSGYLKGRVSGLDSYNGSSDGSLFSQGGGGF
ncbi:unnamed protein product [Urochloa decumbens]|uniref:DUF4283 domain-containing protein n=1 Tax=Urochloa decumbens TaxID=240449 RepID=A0ABC9CJ67_9POAL